MNRTVKNATVRAFHYETLDSLKAHLDAFITAYTFAKHLKSLGGEHLFKPSAMPERKTSISSSSARTTSFRDYTTTGNRFTYCADSAATRASTSAGGARPTFSAPAGAAGAPGLRQGRLSRRYRLELISRSRLSSGGGLGYRRPANRAQPHPMELRR